jgi:hypothetical protein
MKQIKIAFSLFTILIAIGLAFMIYFLVFSDAGASAGPAPIALGFQITALSELGHVWSGNAPGQPVDLKQTSVAQKTTFSCDEQGAFEFFFGPALFTALANTSITYSPQLRELCLQSGELWWDKRKKGERIDLTLSKAGNVLALSDAGSIKLNGGEIVIRSHAGALKLVYDAKTYELMPQTITVLNTGGKKGRLSSGELGDAPTFIAPEQGRVTVSESDGAIVQFNWRAVAGVGLYYLKLYSSPLRERVLFSKLVPGTSFGMDLLNVKESGTLYWDVAAYDEQKRLEGIPSRLGAVTISGIVFKDDGKSVQPQLEIQSLSVSGNMVLIKGATDRHARLYINNQAVGIDQDGTFIHSLSFKTVGVKDLTLRAVNSAGIETVIKKQITIFEPGEVE